MIRSILFAILFMAAGQSLAGATYLCAPDTGDAGLIGSATNRARMVAAKHEFNTRNMRGALTQYREILKTEPQNAPALYWTARCHYELKRYDLAKDYLQRAIDIDPGVQSDINFFYGKIHHRLAELKEAIDYFQRFLDANEGKRSFEVEEARRFISQCKYAKEMMNHAVPVEIVNMGPGVNSRFDEYAPAVTADGKTLLFTSRRSDGTGGEIDEGGDYKFYEDIYVTTWNEQKQMWTNAEGVEGDVNTPTYDAVLSVAPDGNSMFVYRNNANSAGSIFISKYNRNDNTWRSPEMMPKPINSSYFESSCSITSDGNTFYFISERPEGMGQGDIYVSERGANGKWSKPQNLGPIINTELDEKFVYIHPNGKTLFFASDGHQTLGSYDIFRSEFVNGKWSIPVNLGYPINTVNEESTFSLSGDNQTMFIAAEYSDALGERDLYQIDVTSYKLLSEGYDQSSYGTLILTVEDAEGKRVKNAWVRFRNDSGSERIIAEAKTDKLGRITINLPGNVSYAYEVDGGKSSEKGLITIALEGYGETTIQHTVVLK